jgi:tRNA(adenine34) deaminase
MGLKPEHQSAVMRTDEEFMAIALAQSRMASEADEVPVGAVVVKNGVVIGVGRNAPIAGHDPTAHAEILAIRSASMTLGNYRLEDCEIFVTLEPCAMCAGAILHARFRRLVFGAADPKTGASGSVVNLFKSKLLNHQTAVSSGVLASQCSEVLSEFFQKKRLARHTQHDLLREDALRTPSERFLNLPDYPWRPRYTNELKGLLGLRLHYLDEGSSSGKNAFFCIHGYRAWSYAYRKVLPLWCAADFRVVAPDLIGFGKSDKPKRETVHTADFHRCYLIELMKRLSLTHVILVCPDDQDTLGLVVAMKEAGLYAGLLVVDDYVPDDLSAEFSAYAAPFPDNGHRAALRAFSNIKINRTDRGCEAEELVALAGIAQFPA